MNIPNFLYNLKEKSKKYDVIDIRPIESLSEGIYYSNSSKETKFTFWLFIIPLLFASIVIFIGFVPFRLLCDTKNMFRDFLRLMEKD